MPVPEHVHRFWVALDERVGHVEATWWGAVVTDERFPLVWDLNYARVDAAAPDLTLREVADAMVPALAEVGTDTFHVVSFQPEETTGLLVELSTLGHALSWDLVMDLLDEPTVRPSVVRVEELGAGDELWSRVEASLALFGNEPAEARQLCALEEAVFAGGFKQWLGVRDDGGEIVALAALVLLEGVAYLDNVATFPDARGRGLASSIVARAIELARQAGAAHVSLLVDGDHAAVVRMYERLGFREVGRLPSSRGPVAQIVHRPPA
jgi:ribosomal protein S18 acetylase RimI-like enzyme